MPFISGLKVDLNGVCSKRNVRNYVFALTEGQWPGDKNLDSILSMLRHVTDLDIEEKGAEERFPLAGDICGGQNKSQCSFSTASGS